MKTLPVSFWCYYLTDYEGVTPRQSDWDAGKIVKGLKGDQIKGYLRWKVGGEWRDFTNDNLEEFTAALLRAVGAKLRETTSPPISIVPIPNSKMSVGAKGKFRTVELATHVADGYGDGAAVVPAIRWDKPRQPAHKTSGYRHPDLYQPHMRLVEAPPSPIVIFDDVRTSGSQMIAATRFLLEKKFTVKRGVTVACATKSQQEKMFEWRDDALQIATTVIDFDEI